MYHEYLGQNKIDGVRGAWILSFVVSVMLLQLMWESAIYENVSGVVVHCIDIFYHYHRICISLKARSVFISLYIYSFIIR